jgi:cytosine permease
MFCGALATSFGLDQNFRLAAQKKNGDKGPMNNPENQSASQLPSYITSAAPNPMDNRAPWYKNTAPTYAGIFLWFVFWDQVPVGGNSLEHPGGTLAAGLGIALFGLVLAALICHALFYLVPGLLGMRTGLPLYIVGTSTFGAQGGFIMPGFLMGVLQFGWLAVNAFASAVLLNKAFPAIPQWLIATIWAILAAFVGLKGIQYVAKVASLVPLLPLGILLIMLVKSMSGLGNFDPDQMIVTQQALAPKGAEALDAFSVIAVILTIVVGFFATAGAAGVDFGLNNRDEKDVQNGGLAGIALAIIITAGISLVAVAGIYGIAAERGFAPKAANLTSLMVVVIRKEWADLFMILLALAAFPPACFSSFIAANSFKTTLPKVNPFLSVGIGTLFSILLAVTGWAGQVVSVFVIIGASFGPICGAMLVDYLLAGCKWTGPRAGFNPAGWIAWALGFIVGILPNLHAWNPAIPTIPAAPVAAFLVGAIVYSICARAGLQSGIVPLPEPLAQTTK